ncbi:Transposase and inactivated derivatives [hydrothermal vent metagenome]|uniref:Transposase and inactivated derivatives n=1 Tax=hydrothermal vent metagenome TaxID=652676 RepID=A0A3B0Z147_9ZZZZ
MARLKRLYFPGVSQHIIQRGNDRQACFYDEADYTVYLDKLKGASKKYNVAVHAYVLMTNHVHILATPSDEMGISRMMQSLGRYYVRYVNHTYSRTGTLWEGRYKSTLVDNEYYLLTVSRYIELNPVRANMVNHPGDYSWSSYQANGLGKYIKLLTPHNIYVALGKSAEQRQQAYRLLFCGSISNHLIKEIRDATNKGWVLGEGRFKKQVEDVLGRAVGPRKCGGDRKSAKYRAEIENQRL